MQPGWAIAGGAGEHAVGDVVHFNVVVAAHESEREMQAIEARPQNLNFHAAGLLLISFQACRGFLM
jgi:hypothetical protein